MRDQHRERGVALLIVLMLTLGLLILGQAAMLLLDQVAQRSGTFRRYEVGSYCAEEGLNLGRAWVLQNMNNSTQLNPNILNDTSGNPGTPPGATAKTGFFADPTDGSAAGSMVLRDLCTFNTTNPFLPTGGSVTGLNGLCRADPTIAGQSMYRINIIDDIDEAAINTVNPFQDTNSVFIIRSECISSQSETRNGQGLEMQDVAMVEVNQSGAANCYGNTAAPTGVSSNSAGCGGGYSGS